MADSGGGTFYPLIRAGRSGDGTRQQAAGAAPPPQQQQQGPPPRPGMTATVSLGSSSSGGLQQYDSPKAGSAPYQRQGFATSAGGVPPASTLLPPPPPAGRAAVTVPVLFAGRKPLRRDASLFALLALLAYCAASVYYLYVRIAFTLDLTARSLWYSICVLVVEVVGMSAVLPYAVFNVVHTHPAAPGSTGGLPPDDGVMSPDKRFALRILVPCYTEPIGTVSATITAALEADLPPGTRRELYLCDDGKDPAKKAWLEHTYGDGRKGRVHYITGRQRAKGEINGKSSNLNNVLAKVIFASYASPSDIPGEEVLVVFDADMAARRNFFCKILEVMCDDSIALCLSPQAFSNVNPATDIFNNSNAQFWEYVLPGLDALGYIACTGTNFCLRAHALASVGWFPDWTITEDYALSMELKAAGFKGAYLAESLAVGEAPEELRNILRQRSRWCKGHMQVFFSAKNPLLRGRLPPLQRWLYTNGTWSYFASVVTSWTFLLVPFLSLLIGLQPVRFSDAFALAATLHLGATFVVQHYFHVAADMRCHWMASVSNNLLSLTYAKAMSSTILSKLHLKKKGAFKVTEKTGGGAGPVGAAFLQSLSSLTRRFNQASLPQLYQPPPAAAPAARASGADGCVTEKVWMFFALSICLNTLVLGVHEAIRGRGISAWLALPCLWAVYNAVPPLLFFVYNFTSGDALHNACFWLQLGQMLSGLGAVVALWFVESVVV